MWAMLNGSFLASRGAIFPALKLSGFSDQEARRSWAAFRYGQWSIARLLKAWRAHVSSEAQWQAHQYEGYRPVAADLTGFFRPRLKGWLGQSYHGLASKALCGVGVGLIGEVGSLAEQRFLLPRKFLRSLNERGSIKQLKGAVLSWLALHLQACEIAILDAGFKLRELHEAGVSQFVLRVASNATARRNLLPAYQGRGARPKYGQLIRPLARTHKGKHLAASQPDEVSCFEHEGRSIGVHSWHGLVRSDQPVSQDHDSFSLMVFFDPLYKQPLVLAVSLPLQPRSFYLLYKDRWPVEHPPLVAKQLLGLTRAFVFSPDSVWRFPELALLAGNILTYLAATLPTIPSGFWDLAPKKTPGRLRRALAKADFPKLEGFSPQLRIKQSVTNHLPKGIEANRRQKHQLRL